MNVTGLEQFHQSKSHDETDNRPFEASQGCLKHQGTLTQGKPTLKRDSRQRIVGRRRFVQAPEPTLSMKTTSLVRKWIDRDPGICLRSAYDYEIFYSDRCNRVHMQLYCASSIAYSGRIACSSANETSRP